MIFYEELGLLVIFYKEGFKFPFISHFTAYLPNRLKFFLKESTKYLV